MHHHFRVIKTMVTVQDWEHVGMTWCSGQRWVAQSLEYVCCRCGLLAQIWPTTGNGQILLSMTMWGIWCIKILNDHFPIPFRYLIPSVQVEQVRYKLGCEDGDQTTLSLILIYWTCQDGYSDDDSNDAGQVRHALGKLGERLETTVLEINEQGKEIDRLRVAVAGIFFFLKITLMTRLRLM